MYALTHILQKHYKYFTLENCLLRSQTLNEELDSGPFPFQISIKQISKVTNIFNLSNSIRYQSLKLKRTVKKSRACFVYSDGDTLSMWHATRLEIYARNIKQERDAKKVVYVNI